MRESEAWRQVAEGIERRGLGASGLCYEIELLALGHPEVHGLGMHQRLRAHIGPHTWAFPTFDADVRILAAYFLALECEDEERANA